MLARFPRLIGVSILALLCFVWLFSGNPSPSFPQQASSGGNSSNHVATPQRNGPNRVHYADIPETTATTTSSEVSPVATDISPVIKHRTPFAYVFWATADIYACSALINIRRLIDFHTPHKIHILLSEHISKPYRDEFELFNVTIHDVDIPEHPHPTSGFRWQRLNETRESSLMKLHAFRMHELDDTARRVVVVDADQYIYQQLDTLFGLPDVDLAAPRNYWGSASQSDHGYLSTNLMVVEPSDRVWKAVEAEIKDLEAGEYVDTIVNKVFAESAMILPSTYGAVDDHWYFWYLPKWYRPENDVLSRGMVEEYHKGELKELWRVINVHVNERPALEPVSQEGEEVSTDETTEQSGLPGEQPAKRSLLKRQAPATEEGEPDEEEGDLGEVLTPEAAERERQEAEAEDGTESGEREEASVDDEEETTTEDPSGEPEEPTADRETTAGEEAETAPNRPAGDRRPATGGTRRPGTGTTRPRPRPGTTTGEEHATTGGDNSEVEADTETSHGEGSHRTLSDLTAAEREELRKEILDAYRAEQEEHRTTQTEEEGGQRQRPQESDDRQRQVNRTPGPGPMAIDTHPDRDALGRLYTRVSVLKFHAVGKPWDKSNAVLKKDLENIAHKRLIDQNKDWREKANKQCPRSPRRKDAGRETEGDWEDWHPVNGV